MQCKLLLHYMQSCVYLFFYINRIQEFNIQFISTEWQLKKQNVIPGLNDLLGLLGLDPAKRVDSVVGLGQHWLVHHGRRQPTIPTLHSPHRLLGPIISPRAHMACKWADFTPQFQKCMVPEYTTQTPWFPNFPLEPWDLEEEEDLRSAQTNAVKKVDTRLAGFHK
jgi:hypothetical protein